MRRAAALLMLLTALAMPSAAFAQSAGDEQYADPFGAEDQQQQEEKQAEQQPQAEQEPAAPAEPVEPAPSSAPAAESSGDVAAAPAQTSEPTLPVTGLPALFMLAAGTGLLAAGAVVRHRL
jgi:hypothetical protein